MSPRLSIAHYRILSKLGEGGMGEVWRATDTKLNRDVAIKILPEAFANDADRMARFTREAQVLASLNHSNIAVIHGVEDRALILELVEGPTLAGRIASGPIPLDEAVLLAKQIAEALEYAHERSVVHRDLKPANIKVTPDGRVKVLDFGLAAVTQAYAGEPANPMSSPTLTMRATQLGTILGTAAYMSPEQAHGREADRRADIWSFGVVLYEMLTGRMAFAGESVSDTLASVLKLEPDWDALPAHTPGGIRRLLRQCLQKDRRHRLQAIGDARIALEETPETAAIQPAERRPANWLPWAVAGILALATAVLGVTLWRATRPRAGDAGGPLLRFSADFGPEALTDFRISAVLSPDGTRVVFPSRGADGKRQLSTRLLSDAKTTPLAGTEGATDPFFKPDGQWIGFFTGGALKKVSINGGAAITLCDCAYNPRGGSWNEDGNIIVALRATAGLFRVPDSGGAPQSLKGSIGPKEAVQRWPQILPGGESVLFTAHTTATGFEDAQIAILSLKTGEWKTVLSGGYFGRYLPGGHLLYVHQGTLFAVGFDVARLETRGTPVPLLSDVSSNATTGAGQLDFSQNGTLVYLSGRPSSESHTIAWLDRAGKTETLIPLVGEYATPRLSPDGKRLAVTLGTQISVFDLERETTTRITSAGTNIRPIWAPDGTHIAYDSRSNGNYGLAWVRADGAGEPQMLLEGKEVMQPGSFSPDGRRLTYHKLSLNGDPDLWTLPLDIADSDHPKAGKPELFLGTPRREILPVFSPDGRWIAYESDESSSGVNEIYVRPFQTGSAAGRWQISSGGGRFAVWSRVGSELLYATPDGHIMAVTYKVTGDAFVAEKAHLWTREAVLFSGNENNWNFDLAPDGKRLVVFPQEFAKTNVHLTFLLNFFDEIRRKLPATAK